MEGIFSFCFYVLTFNGISFVVGKLFADAHVRRNGRQASDLEPSIVRCVQFGNFDAHLAARRRQVMSVGGDSAAIVGQLVGVSAVFSVKTIRASETQKNVFNETKFQGNETFFLSQYQSWRKKMGKVAAARGIKFFFVKFSNKQKERRWKEGNKWLCGSCLIFPRSRNIFPFACSCLSFSRCSWPGLVQPPERSVYV